MKILVAATGASGFPLTTTLLTALEKAGVERHLVLSDHTQKVIEYEGNPEKADLKGLCEHYYHPEDIHTSICSGSFPLDGMVIVPCSMNTLAKVAQGIEDNAISRAAAVNLKQERRVLLVPRETPLTLPQLKNMVRAKEAGCSIVPPVLAYYTGPQTVQDLTNYIVGRILELLRIPHDLYQYWSAP